MGFGGRDVLGAVPGRAVRPEVEFVGRAVLAGAELVGSAVLGVAGELPGKAVRGAARPGGRGLLAGLGAGDDLGAEDALGAGEALLVKDLARTGAGFGGKLWMFKTLSMGTLILTTFCLLRG